MSTMGFTSQSQTMSVQRVVNVGTSSTVFVGDSPTRVALIISSTQTNRFTMSLEETAVLDSEGITIYPQRDPLILTLSDHGDLVTRAWSAICATGAQNVGVIEVFRTSGSAVR